MGSNALFFAWNRSIPGRESVSGAHFEEFVGYLSGLQEAGTIEDFDIVLLNSHGGDMNGFFLIRGEAAALSAVMSGEDWLTHMTRAGMHLEGSGAVRGVTGEEVGARMALWKSVIPD